jgi:predicted nuclease with TOPRIM domain
VRKVLIYLIFGAVMAVLGYELYGLNTELSEVKGKFTELNVEKEEILKDNEKLEANINYFSNPRNLEKELRARFNVRLPEEKLIIVVPED